MAMQLQSAWQIQKSKVKIKKGTLERLGTQLMELFTFDFLKIAF
jgi:hypothetical protein